MGWWVLGCRRSRRSLALCALLVAALTLVLRPASVAGLGRSGCEYEGVDRVVAVADVHGAYDRYVEILRAAGVVDDRQHWVAGRTHLVQLGDVVDRGADSRKVLDLLRDLETAARRAGGAVHVLLGNHEVMRLLGDLRYVSPGEYEAFTTVESFSIRRQFLDRLTGEERARLTPELPLGYVELRLAFGHDGQYGKWLRTLDSVIRIDGVVFVHGGLSPEVGLTPCGAINETVRRELTADIDKTRAAPLKSLAASANGPFWYRGLGEESDEFRPKLEEILQAQKARAIVVGHSVQPQGRIQVRYDGKVFALDTGMLPEYAKGGRASALEIRNGVFTAIYTDRRDVLADRRQPASGRPR